MSRDSDCGTLCPLNCSTRRTVLVGLIASLLGLCIAGNAVVPVVAQTDEPGAAANNVSLVEVYTTGTAEEYREVRDLEPTDDGGLMALVVTGASGSETTILQIDGSGALISEETVAGRYETITRVDDDSYAAAGARGGYAQLMRIHEDGWVQWTERYGSPNETDVAIDVVSAPDGDAYLMGSTESVDNTTSDLWVLRVDDEGEVRWDRVVEHESWTAFPEGERLSDGSLIATAQTQRSTDGAVDGNHDVFAVRLAPTGSVEWQTEVSGPRDSTSTVAAFDVVSAHEDGVVLVGASNDSDEATVDAWAAQLSPGGNVEWQQQYDSDGPSVSQAAVRSADGYVLAGGTAGQQGPLRGQLLVIDSDGDEQRKTTVTRNKTGRTRVQSVAWAGDGRLAVGGLLAIESEAGRQSEGWIALVDDGLDSVDPGLPAWITQHSDAERAGQESPVEDSSLDSVLFAATAISVGLLLVPYGLRRFRRRR